MRWQPFAVVAAMAAPPLVLAVLVWPSGASAGDGGDGGGGDDVEAELSPGDSVSGSVAGTGSVDYLIVGDGEGTLQIDVTGGGFDSTLTLVDPESGESLDHNDDTNGLDPQLTIDLDDDETVVAQVRSLGGDPGSFEITVSHGRGSNGRESGNNVGTSAPPGVLPGPTVVVPAGPATTVPAG